MSTSTIKYPTPIQDFTASMTTSHTKGAVFSGMKAGRICNITIQLTFVSAVSAYGTICTIPDGYRPLVQQIYSADGFEITATGNIRSITSRTSGSTISFTACYISQV